MRRLGRHPRRPAGAVVERKTLADLVSSLLSGRLRFLVGELDTLPRAAVVIEDRYSQGFRLDRVRPAAVRMDLGYEDLFTLTAPAAPEPNTAEVRAWARTAGLAVPDRGRLRPEVWAAWRAAHAH